MTILISIKTCKDCRHLDHSGGFTCGGSRPVCSHHDACYGSHAKVQHGETAVDVMIRTGMDKSNAEKYVQRAIKDHDGEIERLLLIGHNKGDCYHWAHRVPFTNWEAPDIPEWCPLKSGSEY